jgi:hypothetical protein
VVLPSTGVFVQAPVLKHSKDEPKWANGFVDKANQSRDGPTDPWEVLFISLGINNMTRANSGQVPVLGGVDGSASLSSKEVVYSEVLHGLEVVIARTFIVPSGRYGPSASVTGEEASGEGTDGILGGTGGTGIGCSAGNGGDGASMGEVPEGVCLRVQPGPANPLSSEEMQGVAACLTAAKEASSADCLVFEKSHLDALGAAGLVLVLPRPVDFVIKVDMRVVARVVKSLPLPNSTDRAHAQEHAKLYAMGKITPRGDHDGVDKKSVRGHNMASFGLRQCSGSTGPNAFFGHFLTKDPKQAGRLAAALAGREYAGLQFKFGKETVRLGNIVDAKGTAPHAPTAVIPGTCVTLKTVTLNYSSRLHTDRKDHEEGGSFVAWWDFLEEGTLFMPGLFWLTTGLAFIPGSGSAMWVSSHELLHQSEPCMCWQRGSDGAWRWAGRVGGLQQGRYGTALTVNPTTLTSWVGRSVEVHDKVDAALKDAGKYSLEKAQDVITDICEDVKTKGAKKTATPRTKRKSTVGAKGKSTLVSKKKVSQGTKKKVSQGTKKKVSQGTKKKVSQGTKKKVSQGTKKKVSQGTKKKVSQVANRKPTEVIKRKAAEETKMVKRRRC